MDEINNEVTLLRSIIESAPTAMIVIDENGIITLTNKQTENYFGYSRGELIGNQFEILMPEKFRKNHAVLRKGFLDNPETRAMGVGRDLYAIRKDSSLFPVEIGLNPINTQNGMVVLATILDITKRKADEHEREKLIIELEDALAKIKTLKGLIPICSNCKKIRDDKGFWNQIEEYITKHSEAMFSHGICPDCTTDLYGDLDDI
ncbi:MAG: PAS domain S-box protein [Calditrichaeota bacterium]|nr:MAG: PAS domain S-box protein [Calditrichota bacterium]MBL1205063.1 PAS domain S-box protein [Calditrichota bacterium]NOG44893.1 PAS domain S-box protein [Calditrichota bacterium]